MTTLPTRLAWLVACFLAGLAIGYAGDVLTGNQYWYLAIPAMLATGWLFLADPTQCEPPARKPSGGAKPRRM
ncbi:MAG: hypothetical protein ACT4P9_02005 [Betaproteobacteria bacterium]